DQSQPRAGTDNRDAAGHYAADDYGGYRRLRACNAKSVCTVWRHRPPSYRLSRSMSSLSRFAKRKKLSAMSREGLGEEAKRSAGTNSSEPFVARASDSGRGSPHRAKAACSRVSTFFWRELRKPRRISVCIRSNPVSIDVARRSRQKSEASR